jgi:hypothetical protein
VRRHLIAIILFALFLAAPPRSSAQRLHVFLTGGSHTDNSSHYAGVTGGAVYDLAYAWVSVGAAGDVFFSGGYAAGRAGPVAQLNFLQGQRLRPFAIGGMTWGEGDGPMIGGGVEFRPRNGFGFRASAEDVLKRRGRLLCGAPQFPPCNLLPHDGNPYFTHGLSLQFGVVFR